MGRVLRAVCVVVLGIGLLDVRLAQPAHGASAPVPTFVVAGDDPAVTGDQWGLHEAYFAELRSELTDAADFGPSGVVKASFTIASPRAVPLTAHSLDGIDVYFTAARDISSSEATVLRQFILRGGAVVVNSNAPGFFDDTQWLGFTLSPRVVYGDGPPPYATTHRAPSPSTALAGQSAHPLLAGPFGDVTSFENWHTVAGFTALPAGATALADTTLTGPDDNGSATLTTITDVTTLAVLPAGALGPGSGPVVATSDVDTFSNAYTYAIGTPAAIGYPVTDALCTLVGTANGRLAGNTFAWIAAQLGTLRGSDAGLLRVTTSPPVPSQISVDGAPADTWGLTWVKTSPGAHTVCFRDVPGFATPPCQTVTATAGTTTTVVGEFRRRATVRVTTSPPVSSTISVDGIPRDDWSVWTSLDEGPHTVCFGPVRGFRPPSCQDVQLVAGQSTVLTGTFVADPSAAGPTGAGSLRAVSSPAVPTQVIVDGVVRDDWSAWVTIAPGDHTVCFTAVDGYATPPCRTVTVTAGATTTVTGSFTPHGFLRVTTSPAVAATVVVDGVARNDWGMWTDLDTGSHQVCFGAVAGRIAPACVAATVTAGATTTVTGTYG